MTKKEFIEKWNVAYENKEQKIEFAKEMENDLEYIEKNNIKSISKEWKDSEFECPECGNLARIQTKSKKDGWYFDGDDLYCQYCDIDGQIICDDDGLAWDHWEN